MNWRELAWLEEQSPRYLNVPTVARRLNPMRRPYERANDECGGFANCVERPELDPHCKRFEWSTIRLSVCQRSVRVVVVVVRLSADNVRDEEERKGRVLKGERGFEFVDDCDEEAEKKVTWPRIFSG